VDWRPPLAVLAGALLGSALRLALDSVIPHADDAFPVSTLVVNTVGSFVLGLLVARLWPSASDWVKAMLGAGLLGSFTTYSAFAVSLVALSFRGEWMAAVLYLFATLALGLGAAVLGLRLGGRTASARRTEAGS
jgi:CrcB protein